MAEPAVAPQRELGLRDLVLFNLAALSSTRWLAAAAHAGSGALTLWVFAAVLFLVPCALVVAYLARRFPEDGGFYIWVRQAFGEWHAYNSAWFYYVTNLFWIPGVLVSTLAMLINSLPATARYAESPPVIIPLSFVLLFIIILVNYVGMHAAKWVDNLAGGSVYFMWAALVTAGVAIVLHRGPATRLQLSPNWDWQRVNFWSQMTFAFVGLELSPILSGEIRDPRRTIRQATWISTVLVTLFYVFGTGAILFILRPDQVSPVIGLTQTGVQAGGELGWPWLPFVIALAILFSLGGQLGTYIAGSARLPFVIGIGDMLPPAFARLHPRYRTPYVSILLLGIGSGVLLLLSQMGETFRAAYQVLIDLTVISQFIPFVYIFAAAWRFGQKLPAAFGFAISLLAILVSLVPTADVRSVWLFELKLVGGSVLLFLIGRYFYTRYRRSV